MGGLIERCLANTGAPPDLWGWATPPPVGGGQILLGWLRMFFLL